MVRLEDSLEVEYFWVLVGLVFLRSGYWGFYFFLAAVEYLTGGKFLVECKIASRVCIANWKFFVVIWYFGVVIKCRK